MNHPYRLHKALRYCVAAFAKLKNDQVGGGSSSPLDSLDHFTVEPTHPKLNAA